LIELELTEIYIRLEAVPLTEFQIEEPKREEREKRMRLNQNLPIMANVFYHFFKNQARVAGDRRDSRTIHFQIKNKKTKTRIKEPCQIEPL